MALEKTLSIIKPDAVSRNLIGAVNKKLEDAGLKIIAQKMINISKNQAMQFYIEHENRPFYDSLCEYMVSGPVVVQVLEGEGAVDLNRKIMGATNPANADVGTIRREFGQSIEHNSVHGSDSIDSANREISFFFSQIEIIK